MTRARCSGTTPIFTVYVHLGCYTLAIHSLYTDTPMCTCAVRYTYALPRHATQPYPPGDKPCSGLGSGMCSSEPSPHPLAVPRPSHVTMLTCLLPSCPFRWTHWYTSPSFAHGQVRAYAELDKQVALHETENEQQQAPHTANWSTVRYSGDGSVVVDGRRSATEANRHAVPESLPGTVPGNVPGSAPGTVTSSSESGPQPMLHILTCETRAPKENAPGAEPQHTRYDLGPARRLARRLGMEPTSKFVQTLSVGYASDNTGRISISNACKGKPWRGFRTKVSRIAEHASALVSSGNARPRDLILTIDADVLFNLPALTAAEVFVRFEEAREENDGRVRILFQAEAWCWAPHKDELCPHNDSRFQCLSSCWSELFGVYSRLPSPQQRPPMCQRFLNAGGAIGYAADMSRLYSQLAAPSVASWLAGDETHEWALGRLGPAACNGDDQCLAHHISARLPLLKR